MTIYKEILMNISQLGINGYLVGGTTRDLLMGMHPKDIDIVTNKDPVSLNSKGYKYNEKYHQIKYKKYKYDITISQFRTEKYKKTIRHPDRIKFTKSMKKDFQRRDFTVNAIYMDVEGNIISFKRSIDDLSKNILRMIGSPNKRLKEDPIRILRALRFIISHDFTLDKKLKRAIYKNRDKLNDISIYNYEREMDKMVSLDDFTYLLKRLEIFDNIREEIKEKLNERTNN